MLCCSMPLYITVKELVVALSGDAGGAPDGRGTEAGARGRRVLGGGREQRKVQQSNKQQATTQQTQLDNK